MSGIWKPARHKYGVVTSNFVANTINQALQLYIGETVHVLEEYWPDPKTDKVTWLRGCTISNKNKKGIFPCCYIAFKECAVENEGPFETVTPVEDAVITEIIFVLREWNTRWKMLFVERKQLFQTILLVMGELARYRAQLASSTLTREKALEQKHSAIIMMDWGNSQLGLDLVPRVEYQQADPDQLSVVEMFRIHEQSVHNCQGAWPNGMMKVIPRDNQNEKIFHLLITLCNLGCDIGDNAEVYLSLYDNTSGNFISERFVMHFIKTKQTEASDKSLSTIFTDLVADDLRRDIYLVVQIFRKGRLNSEGSFKKLPVFQYRRPWGISVLCLKDLFQIQPEAELEYFLSVHCVDNENFFNMHESLIRRQVQLLGKSLIDKQNQGITLSVKILHGDMKNVKIDNPMLFNKPSVVLTQRMGFSEFINPGEVRNDLYLTLIGADFDRGSKTASKNIEARVTVNNHNYEIIKDCILSASGDQMSSTFFSYVLYHSNTPKWQETIRLSIPIEKFNVAHVRIELCHCSNRDKAEKKMYGFAFLSLTKQGNIAQEDGKYDLRIYKCDDSSKVKNYLRLPYLRDESEDFKKSSNEHCPYQQSSREFLSIRTLLCSTKFAQKTELLNVLQWRSNPSKILYHLDSLIKLKGQELVRYLQDVLDALFDMFTAGEKEQVPFAMEIFQTLVHIFNLLHEDKFKKFSDVLEEYLQKSFSSPLAHRDLMLCLKKQAERIYTCSDFDESNSRKVFKVIGDIFKFAVQSCIISKRINADQPVKEFKRNLNLVFDTLGNVLKSTEVVLHKAQVAAGTALPYELQHSSLMFRLEEKPHAYILSNLHKCFIPLLHVESLMELAQIVKFLLSRVNVEPGSKVTKAKTSLVKHVINSPLFQDAASRSMLLPLCLAHIRKCLVNKKNLDLTANTLGDLLSSAFKLRVTCNISEEVTQIIQSVFDATVRILKKLEKEERKIAGSLLVACFMEMLRLMDVGHYQKLLGDFQNATKSKVRLSTLAINHISNPAVHKNFLNRILLVFKDLITTSDYPADWTTMRLVTNNVMLTSIQYISEDLATNFLNGPDFDKELWYNFFLLAVYFITQPELQLEKYSEAKSSMIKDKYQDMRVPFGVLINSLWNQLGPNKQHLIIEMIGPFLKVTMVRQTELRKATIPIFFDIIKCEFSLKGDLRRVESKMIHELDSLVIEHNGDVEYKEMFTSILLDKVQAEPELKDEGERFVFSVTDLLNRLLDYRDIMDREEQRDTKMHCTFNILNFYKGNRIDMYIRYILRLFDLHYNANNFVEAGLTLKLYAKLLTWSTDPLPPEMSYPSATEAERKEELYTKIIACFDRGKAWEYGLPLCKELTEYYETSFQYNKLADILKKQATFYQNILGGNQLRQDPIYYRVAYYGNTFPLYLKNKAFIYRGDECLRLATIMNQLTTEYPLAQILTSNLPVDESCKTGDGQYIQLVSVKPVPVQRLEFINKEVPTEISSFYNSNEVDTFQFDRPYHRDDKDKNNEFKSLCLERTVMKSSYPLPGILRWYEVVKTETLHFCPVQTAYMTVQQMNEELRLSSDNAANCPEQYLSHLSMRLQGVISGAVNGGIPKYQEAFFNQDYQLKYPNESEHIEKLKLVIHEQIQLLERGLSIQGKYASQEMLPLHHSLEDMFSKMKMSMGYQTPSKHRGSTLSVLSNGSSQRPATPSTGSLNSSNRSSIVSSGEANEDDDNLYLDPSNLSAVSPSPSDPMNKETLGQSASQQPPPYIPRKISISTVSADVVNSLTSPSSNSGMASFDQRPKTYNSEASVADCGPPLPPRTVQLTSISHSETVMAKTPPIPNRKPSVGPLISPKFKSENNLSPIYNNSQGFNSPVSPTQNSLPSKRPHVSLPVTPKDTSPLTPPVPPPKDTSPSMPPVLPPKDTVHRIPPVPPPKDTASSNPPVLSPTQPVSSAEYSPNRLSAPPPLPLRKPSLQNSKP